MVVKLLKPLPQMLSSKQLLAGNKVKQFSVLFLLFLSLQVAAQEYGKPRLQDLTFNKYPKDTNAEAVMIFDIGKSNFSNTDQGFELLFERTAMIRIIKTAGLKWGEVEIPYYYEGNVLERVDGVEAASYNIEGGVIKKTSLNIKTIYDKKINEYWRAKTFAIPNVREGSVVEFKYSIRSPYLFNIRDWEFQRSIPTVYSEYTTRMIPFYEYTYIMQGKSKFDVYENYADNVDHQFGSMNYKEMVYKFVMKDMPAFRDESFITSVNDYLCKIDFQLARIHRPDGSKTDVISTWPKLCNDLLKESSFGRYISSVEKTSDKILNLAEISSKSQLEKLEYIVNKVKTDFSWNGSSSKYAHKTMKELLKEKTGNSADLNLYLTGLLKGAGIEAFPVLVSTRGNGSVYTEYPFLHFFNYVIVLAKIDGKLILTDVTEVLCPFNRIPSRCINNVGLVVKKDSEEWLKLANSEVSMIEKVLNMNFDLEEDSVKFRMNSKFSLFEAVDYKKNYKNDFGEIMKGLTAKGYNTTDSLITENFEQPNEKYRMKFMAKVPIDHVGDKIYVSPFLNEPLTENPLKQTIRAYPVDFTYPFGRAFFSTILIPQGYKVEFVPIPLIINNAVVSVDYKVANQDNNKITVTGTYVFKKAIYESVDYTTLKFVYNEIIKKFNEKIVFVKI